MTSLIHAATGAAGDRERRALSHRAEIAIVRELWNQQSAANTEQTDPAGMAYLASHFSMELTLKRHLKVIDAISPYIRGRVLEWGCRHALDSCVYRMRFGSAVELHGCDGFTPGTYQVFHAFSGIRYAQLHHPYHLDYDDETFDVVTSNGVLEHVPDDRSSIQEIFRVLKPGGTFVVTCLPNRYSYTEALQRLRSGPAHDRLYTIRLASGLLLDAGFQVKRTSYFLMLPTMLNGFPRPLKQVYRRMGGLVWATNSLLERLWPLNRLASNLLLIATKPDSPGSPRCSGEEAPSRLPTGPTHVESPP
ncbi:MAG TPA: methyltransferase domain-containing protein [Isosphaeraceae bacterium]|jgi:SAM-dependent methyltransferase|nr:methyltransferase domain-containing protein [Isosphaeraceae bacterium]